MKIENLIKGIFTTILGCIMMGFAFYGWYFEEPADQLTDLQAGGLLLAGFVLCFLRLKVEEALSKILGDTPVMIWRKIFGSKEPNQKQ